MNFSPLFSPPFHCTYHKSAGIIKPKHRFHRIPGRRRRNTGENVCVVIVSEMLDLKRFNPNARCKTQPPICLRAFKARDYSAECLRSADVWMLRGISRHLHFGSPENQVGIKKMIKAQAMAAFRLNLCERTFTRHLQLAGLANALGGVGGRFRPSHTHTHG